ncbi:MAG: hypothetical protein IPJ77_22075 [Planctomycetes bacterium]|nr:hypothetical protein [Planctomycetota bacterium]
MADSMAALAVQAVRDPDSAAVAAVEMDRMPTRVARAETEASAVRQDPMAVSAVLEVTEGTVTTPVPGVRVGPASFRVVPGERAETRPRRGLVVEKAGMEERAPVRTGRAARAGRVETLLTGRVVLAARAEEEASSVLAVPVVQVAMGPTWGERGAMVDIQVGPEEAAAIAQTAWAGRGGTAATASMEQRAMEAREATRPMARVEWAVTVGRPPTVPVEREDRVATVSTGMADWAVKEVRPTRTVRVGKAVEGATAATEPAVKAVPAGAARRAPAAREATAGRARMGREEEAESVAR